MFKLHEKLEKYSQTVNTITVHSEKKGVYYLARKLFVKIPFTNLTTTVLTTTTIITILHTIQ